MLYGICNKIHVMELNRCNNFLALLQRTAIFQVNLVPLVFFLHLLCKRVCGGLGVQVLLRVWWVTHQQQCQSTERILIPTVASSVVCPLSDSWKGHWFLYATFSDADFIFVIALGVGLIVCFSLATCWFLIYCIRVVTNV